MSTRKSASQILKSQLLFANKQNKNSQINEDVTRSRKYTQTSQKDQRHETTFIPSKKVLEDQMNKTTIIKVKNQKSQRPSAKIDDLQVHRVMDKSTNDVQDKQNHNSILSKNIISQNKQHQQKKINAQIISAPVTKDNGAIQKAPKQIITHKIQQQQKPIQLSQKKIVIQQKKNKKYMPPIKPTTNKQIKPQNQQQSAANILKQHEMVDQSTHKFQNVYPQNTVKTTNQVPVTSYKVFEQFSHVMKQVKKDYKIIHTFNRDNSCIFSDPVLFQLSNTKNQTLSSEKVSRIFSSQFKIYLGKNDRKNQLGTLKSNFTGSSYNFYPKGTDAIYFSILFDKVKDLKQNIRYSQIYINNYATSNGQDLNDQIQIPYKKLQNLQSLYRVNKLNHSAINKIFRFTSKLPAWSQSKQCYNLDFGKDKSTVIPSAINTIFIDESEKQVMKFYKNSNLTYNTVFSHPFSWIIAYGYALATTDFKISSQ